MVYHSLQEEVVGILKKEGASTREEIASKLKDNPNRAILMGYLRCLVDLGIIESKDVGRTKLYFLKEGRK
tara:strand:+ start:716 stop:925 length:210 start_codon:yes stop_codon:yes gene_type:complete